MTVTEFERSLIVERIKSGLAEAHAKGRHLGRPVGVRPSEKVRSKVLSYLAQGHSIRETAKLCKCGTATVQRFKREAKGREQLELVI